MVRHKYPKHVRLVFYLAGFIWDLLYLFLIKIFNLFSQAYLDDELLSKKLKPHFKA